ncbi:FHA domain-containing protein, partial [Thermodesulfobacteriota bacterium]
MPSLHVVSNDGRIYNYTILKDTVSIGRGKDNDISLTDNTVSRNHARIIKSEDEYALIDL